MIEKLDGQRVTGKEELIDLLKYYAAGEVVEMQIARYYNGEYQEAILSVTLGSRYD